MQSAKILSHILFSVLLLGFLISCNDKKHENGQGLNEASKKTMFSLLDEETTGIGFINQIENKEDFNIFTYRNFYNGGGVSIGDVNNDGLPDIYMTSNFGKNRLYLNKGNFKFEDISETAGVGGKRAWSTGVAMVDLNSDGLLDIYVCNAGNIKGDNQKNELFINNGDLTFTEKASAYNLDEDGSTTHAAFFDYDKDGDLDAYILNNSFIPVTSLNYSNKRELRAKDWEAPEVLKGGGDKLLRNDGGTFVDISEEAGIYGSLIGFGLGVTVGDVNNDLYPDIYISNDFYERDYLYINQRNGKFIEDIKNWTSHTSLASMGADMQDINNDGKPDIFVTDMLPENDERLKNTTSFEGYDIHKRKIGLDFHNQYMQNSLQLNVGNGKFSEIAFYGGVAKTDWSWGALVFDMDNDGYRDIYVCNGIAQDLTNQDFIDFFANDILQNMILTGKKEDKDSIINKMPSTPIPNYAFKNNGDLTFSNTAKEWGLDVPSFSNGAAYGDLDNDGDLDLVINNVNQKAFVFRNNLQETNPKNYIKLEFKGKSDNTFAIGTLAELYVGDQVLRHELIPTRGFQSSMEYIMTVGLNETKKIDSIKIVWPDNSLQILRNVSVNQSLVLNQTDSKEKYNNLNPTNETLLKQLSQRLGKHEEDSHIDFDYEGLISGMLSQEGPAMAVGDLNGDGNDDIFIGGAKNQSGDVYLQTNNKKFTKIEQSIISLDVDAEDTSAAIFDADGDGDMDLLVASGGNNPNDAEYYTNRLYINNGKGNFIEKINLPTTRHNVSVIAASDFDKDGDVDVFIGSRSVPSVYGVNPKHLFLENSGTGDFKDVTESKAYDVKDIGMITDAKWADIDKNGKEDLVIVGDWMAPTIFKNNGRRLSLKETNLDSLTGWWNTIETVDIDNDGDLDFVLGNRGENIPYKASTESPVKMFVNDFDNNGTIEQITTRTIEGEDRPIILKKELTAQIASLKKQTLQFSDFATKSIENLFNPEIIDNSIIKSVTETKSMLVINNGAGNFTTRPLPKEAQFSCVCGISCQDVNGDGYVDILLGGNNFELKPQYSRSDASYGGLLLGNGKGNLTWTPYDTSGFFVEGEIKHLEKVKNKDGNFLFIAAINNETPKIFELND